MSTAVPAADVLAHVADYPHLPTPPAVALEVIQLASRPDCELEEIAHVLAKDADLCGQVMRVVNSSVYGLARPIATVERAVGYLGLKSVRSLVLALSLPTMRLQTSNDPRLRDVWRGCVAGALIARELAVKLNRPDAEDDMVAALLGDLGVFVLQQIFPVEYAPILDRPAEVLAFRQCDLEEEALGVCHADVTALVLSRWKLPADLVEPIRFHHRPDGAPTDRVIAERSRLLYLVMRFAQLQDSPRLQPAFLREALDAACDEFGLSEERFLEFLDPLNRKIDEFVAILGLDVGPLASFSTIVANASVELVQLELATRRDRAREDEGLKRWRRLAKRLRAEATRDRLTGTYNRSAFEEALGREFRRARRRCTVLGLLVFDLNHFRAFNDVHGLPFGDQALKDVASLLKREVAPGDVVARFAGDQFCVLLPDTTPEQADVLANRLRVAVAGLRVKWQEQTAGATVSVGAAVCLPRHTPGGPADLLEAGEGALRSAKIVGTNSVCVASLLTDDDTALLAEVHARLFSTYLLESEAVTEEQVREARRAMPATPVLVGRLARRFGWLTPRRLKRVLRAQKRNGTFFGESAAALGYLTPAQVIVLQALQREPPADLAEGLVDVRALEVERAQEEVTRFLRSAATAPFLPSSLSTYPSPGTVSVERHSRARRRAIRTMRRQERTFSCRLVPSVFRLLEEPTMSVAALAAALVLSLPAEPTWITDYAEAKAAAKKSGKPIFLVFR